ncbi:MAG TPA: cupin domain-containing protein [Terrimicrobiaceae bacterium]|nr:cupin domain-containing protein [Terrimicrobiaceae bacterium]
MNVGPASVSPDQFETLAAFGEKVILHLTGKHTAGKVTAWTEITPPGGGPPPHYHLKEDEWFMVGEGTMAFFYDDQWHELGPGGVAFMPRETIHTFKNIGTTPSRMLVHTSPSGFETFFAHCAQEFAKPDGPDMQRIVEIGIEHGIHFLPPPPA